MRDITAESWSSSYASELSVIGAALQSRSMLPEILKLKPDDFTDKGLAAIHKAVARLYDAGKPVDLITVENALNELVDDKHEQLEFTRLAVDAMTYMPATANAPYYIAIVAEKSNRRKLYSLGEGLMKAAQMQKHEFAEIQARAARRIGELQPASGDEDVSAKAIALAGYEYAQRQANGKERAGMTGIPEIDNGMGGMHNGEMTILAARPGVGKTTFAWQIADVFARRGQRVMFVSMEMSHEQLATRWFAQYGADASKIRHGDMQEGDWTRLANILPEISMLPIYAHTKIRTLAQITAQVEKYKRDGGLGILIIDYLQLLQSGKRTQNQNAEISAISGGLKSIALTYNIPVLCLSQLNRDAARRGENIFPNLTDLRDSGSIEQDADNVIFLAVPKEENQATLLDRPLFRQCQDSGNKLMYLDIAKQRQGEQGRYVMQFRPRDMKVYSMMRDIPVDTPKAIREWDK